MNEKVVVPREFWHIELKHAETLPAIVNLLGYEQHPVDGADVFFVGSEASNLSEESHES